MLIYALQKQSKETGNKLSAQPASLLRIYNYNTVSHACFQILTTFLVLTNRSLKLKINNTIEKLNTARQSLKLRALKVFIELWNVFEHCSGYIEGD